MINAQFDFQRAEEKLDKEETLSKQATKTRSTPKTNLEKATGKRTMSVSNGIYIRITYSENKAWSMLLNFISFSSVGLAVCLRAFCLRMSLDRISIEVNVLIGVEHFKASLFSSYLSVGCIVQRHPYSVRLTTSEPATFSFF